MSRIGPELLGQLFDAHSDALGMYARQWTDSPADAAQEAFLQLARQRKLPDRVVPWLYKVARNAAIEASRRDGRRRKREAKTSSVESWFAPTDDRIDGASVSKHLQGLDCETRSEVIARICGGFTFEEVAEARQSAEARLDRRLAALRIIEAIRLQAASDGGKLPESLAKVTIVPIPLNPATSQSFSYRAEGAAMVLESPLFHEGKLTYRIVLRK